VTARALDPPLYALEAIAAHQHQPLEFQTHSPIIAVAAGEQLRRADLT
jgi:hypothetical protein